MKIEKVNALRSFLVRKHKEMVNVIKERIAVIFGQNEGEEYLVLDCDISLNQEFAPELVGFLRGGNGVLFYSQSMSYNKCDVLHEMNLMRLITLFGMLDGGEYSFEVELPEFENEGCE